MNTSSKKSGLHRRKLLTGLAIVSAGAIIWSLGRSPAGPKPVNLTRNITPQSSQWETSSQQMHRATADFSVCLLQRLANVEQNTLISPLCAYFALGMTTNGAGEDTRAQLLSALGHPADCESVNWYCRDLYESLSKQRENTRVTFANSIWIQSGTQVKNPFLQCSAESYRADAYKLDFDHRAVEEMNTWVRENTDGLIPDMVDALDPRTQMILLSTLLFDGEWAIPYVSSAEQPGTFHLQGGKEVQANYLTSVEEWYLDDVEGNAVGFSKPYSGGEYSFVAILPPEGTPVQDYLQSLTGGRLLDLLRGAIHQPVQVTLPRFRFDSSFSLREALNSLGVVDAFDSRANFTGITDRGLHLDDVLQKTFIQVDTVGTRAGAATAVVANVLSAVSEPPVQVTLDRPFLFAIVHNQTNLPLFLGILHNPAN